MTNDVPSPTAADRERDLAADHALAIDMADTWQPLNAVKIAWGIAIRRALWAERLLAELREATDNERNHVGIWDSIDDEKRRQVMGAAMLRLVAAVNKAERLEKALDSIWWEVSAGMDNAGPTEPHDTIRQMVDEALGRTTKEGM